jgi:hypothetical protein
MFALVTAAGFCWCVSALLLATCIVDVLIGLLAVTLVTSSQSRGERCIVNQSRLSRNQRVERNAKSSARKHSYPHINQAECLVQAVKCAGTGLLKY